MIGDYAKRDVDLDLCRGAHAAGVLVAAARGDFLDRRAADRHTRAGCAPLHIWNGVRVLLTAEFFEFIEDWPKNIGLVVRNRTREIGQIFCALNDCSRTFETHSGINVTRCEWEILTLAGFTAPGYRLRIELDEHQVPNFNATRVAFVH